LGYITNLATVTGKCGMTLSSKWFGVGAVKHRTNGTCCITEHWQKCISISVSVQCTLSLHG